MNASLTRPPLKVACEFDGIGGFPLGLTRAGMVVTHSSEIIKARQRVLTEHFPETPQGGDIRHVHGTDLGRPDVVAAGFPCKQTSTGAPHRQGLDGEDSKLFWEVYRILGESLGRWHESIDPRTEYHANVAQALRLVASESPRWVLIENVPGLLTSRGGADLAAVVSALGYLGYGVAWRVVDGRHIRLRDRPHSPQYRPRLILVGHRGGDPRPAWQVLGDAGPGGATDAPRDDRIPGWQGPRAASRREALAAVGVSDYWRKGANARAAIDAGGWETWIYDEDYTNTLSKYDAGNATRQKHLLVQHERLRTFTPREHERLACFPDDWTESMSYNARMEAIGDSVQPTLVEFFGRRIISVDATLPQIGVKAA